MVRGREPMGRGEKVDKRRQLGDRYNKNELYTCSIHELFTCVYT